jgi:hypothetical protein
MQLAMYQMLTNLGSNPTTPSPQPIPSLQFRSLPDQPKPLKRLVHKRPRLVKNNPTSE